ncbi:hypothetical protein DFH07DRAFT_826055 [Mycena maculata]|uniref:Uncharacterized protein n=1 Tax=Mycena maculata TaxID=230809 RepID=A0AAD7NAN3_9AGAR|nr:hypothetical protein DFH07DRAFT_826055 [Mycena maculata]
MFLVLSSQAEANKPVGNATAFAGVDSALCILRPPCDLPTFRAFICVLYFKYSSLAQEHLESVTHNVVGNKLGSSRHRYPSSQASSDVSFLSPFALPNLRHLHALAFPLQRRVRIASIHFPASRCSCCVRCFYIWTRCIFISWTRRRCRHEWISLARQDILRMHGPSLDA